MPKTQHILMPLLQFCAGHTNDTCFKKVCLHTHLHASVGIVGEYVFSNDVSYKYLEIMVCGALSSLVSSL